MSLDRVDARDFLEALGIEIDSVSGDNLIFSCPWHHDTHPSARMNFKTTAWLCSAGCGKGNAIHFLAMLRQMTFDEARDHIYARYGIGPGAPIDNLEAEVRRNLDPHLEQEQERVLPDESWVEYLSIDWEDREHPAAAYMLGRGFLPETLQRWQLGYDELSRRVSIPVRDVNGKLVGFKGRAIDPEQHQRYLILGDPLGAPRPRYGFHTHRKSEYVFALDRCIRSSSWTGVCAVVEGELNAIAMIERHRCFAVAVAGSEFSDRQRELIASHCRRAIVYLDDDLAGSRGTVKVAQALLPFLDVDVVVEAPGDAAELDSPTVASLIKNAQPAMELCVTGDLSLELAT